MDTSVPFKRTCATALFAFSIFILALLVATPALAETTTYSSGGVVCTLDDEGTFTISATDTSGEYDSGEMADYSSTSGDRPWDTSSASIKKVVVNEGVKNIGKYAFYDCSNLASVEIDGIDETGSTNTTFSSIGKNAFSYTTSLTGKVYISYYVSYVPNTRTTYCDYVRVGDKDGGDVLAKGTSGDVNWELYDKYEVNGQEYSKVLVVSGTGRMADYDDLSDTNDIGIVKQDVDCQGVVVEEGVTYIGHSAFKGLGSGALQLQVISLPSTLQEIGDFAFQSFYGNTSLTELTIPASVETIGQYAFYRQEGLKKVVFEKDSKLTSIGEAVFESCFAPDDTDDERLFDMSGCVQLTSLNVDTLLRYTIGDAAENLTVKLPTNLESLNYSSITNIAIAKLVVPSSLSEITGGSFAYHDATSATGIDSIELLPSDSGVSSFVSTNDSADELSASLLTALGEGKALDQVLSVGSLSTLGDLDTFVSNGGTVTIDLAFTGSEQPTVYYLSDADSSTYTAVGAANITGSSDEGWTLQVDSTATGVYATASDVLTAEETATLKSAVSSAETLLNSVTVSTDGTDVDTGSKWVTQAAYDALKSAIDDANALLDSDSSISEEDGASATTALDTAVTAFKSAMASGTKQNTSTDTNTGTDTDTGTGTDTDTGTDTGTDTDTDTGTGTGTDSTSGSSSSTTDSASSSASSTTDSASSSASSTTSKAISLAVGKTFTVRTAAGTFKYRVTAKGKVTLVRATKTKAKKVTVNTVKYKGYTYKVTAIAKGAFKGAKVKRVVIGANVKKVGARAFASAKKLTAVTIGKNVKKIGSRAFSKAKKLKRVTVKSKKLTKGSTVKNCLKGSKVKTVKLSKLGSKKAKVKRTFMKYAGKKSVVVR